MVHVKTISFQEYVWNTYLKDYEGKNLSSYINELIILGSEAKIGQPELEKRKIIKAFKQIREKNDEIAELKCKIGKLHKDIDTWKQKFKIEKEGTFVPVNMEFGKPLGHSGK